MNSWHSYPKIWLLGYPQLKSIGEGECIYEEKLDGSQFSFGVIDGVLRCRSKGKEQSIDAPDKLFGLGIEVVKSVADKLVPNWTYRGEYLQKPKHNVLAYNRVPKQHIAIFDINTGPQTYLSYEGKVLEADHLGFEVIPCFRRGIYNSEQVKILLDETSFLGGQKIEGVVVKNYSQYDKDTGAPLFGKYVSEAFKEVHRGEWRKSNPTKKDIVEQIIERFRTPARWQKAVQHLAECGELTSTPADIGKLIREVQADVSTECKAEIKELLYQWAEGALERGFVRGFPEWYKNKLLEDSCPQS